MTRFSSCYFCGTALDASVSEQPVVPADLRADDGRGRSVTLCPDCSRKLDAVMDEVRAAVDAGAEPGAGPEPASTDPGESGADAADSGGAIDADVSIDASADEFFEEAEPADADDASESAAGGSAITAGSSSAAGASGGSSDTGAAGGESKGADEEGSPRQTISALENSKVMRMLENREFPVERESFQVVAANAYGVSPSDVGKVIDMAIDRGLLAEQNGDLVRPE